MKLPVDKISPNPQQPRRHFDEQYIRELADSIRENGQQNPIQVEDDGDGTYTLVTGECRLRAHKLLGLQEIEGNVRPPTNHKGKQRLIDAMVENVQRDDMNPVDEAHGYKVMRVDHGMSIREISTKIGKKESHIRGRLPIADLDDQIQELIAQNRLPHQIEAVNALLSIPNKDARIELAGKLAERQATVKIVVKACARYMEVKTQTGNKKTRMRHPAVEISNMTSKPSEWDALFQVGKVPPWQKFTESVMSTCDECSLRPIASEATCRDCPVVALCKNLMETTK